MAIEFEKSPEEQLQEETGPALERPLHDEDEEIDDEDGFEEPELAAAYFAALAEDVEEEASDEDAPEDEEAS